MSEGEMVMAWIKEIEQESTGAVASYWEVISVFYEHQRGASTLVVGGWISQEAYNNSKSPLLVKSWEIPSGLAPALAEGAVGFVSAFAKSQIEFDGYEET